MNVLHWPRLDTVLMVEEHIKENGGTSKKELWRTLPKKVMYQTYCVIVDYLIASGRIAKDRKNNLCYIWDPEGVKYWMSRTDLKWQGESSSRIESSRKNSRAYEGKTSTGTSPRQSNGSERTRRAAYRSRSASSRKSTRDTVSRISGR